ncbi:MAG: hypothetical protein KGK08_01780 [Acidobacteriota bacterium]|nr:hypothetical protein [Acidobacteriota bacterium]
MTQRLRLLIVVPVAVALTAALGCNSPVGFAAPSNAAAQQLAMTETRQHLDKIPVPLKSHYMMIKDMSSWQNPSITVQGGMLTLHVVLADANPSSLGEGGMLRPLGARRQELNIRVNELTAALNAIPDNCWPYGRVVAVEEAHNTPEAGRPAVRKNLETVLKNLNDLDVVGYEWSDTSAGLK